MLSVVWGQLFIESELVFNRIDEKLGDDKTVSETVIGVIVCDMLDYVIYFHFLDCIHESDPSINKLDCLDSLCFNEFFES